MTWKVADAKNQLSEVLNRADTDPQIITRRKTGYVVMTEERYRELTGEKPNFIDFLLSAPQVEGFELPPREVEPPREIDFG